MLLLWKAISWVTVRTKDSPLFCRISQFKCKRRDNWI